MRPARDTRQTPNGNAALYGERRNRDHAAPLPVVDRSRNFGQHPVDQTVNIALPMLRDLLAAMTRQAQTRGLSDREWAAAAGVRHETLCRVKWRGTCDAATLQALAHGCGLELALRAPGPAQDATDSAANQLFPAHLSRDMEERLLTLCAHGDVDPAHWRAMGPGFFVAGIANLVASANGLDPDGRYARLADSLHPGVRSLEAFRLWLAGSPVKPSRFLPMLRQLRRKRLLSVV